jgi:nitrogen fixation-related uncharacterized protein
LASIIAIVVMLPSIYLFYMLWKESSYKKSAEMFIEQELEPYPDSYLQKNATNIEYHQKEASLIEVSFLGKEIPSEVIDLWESKLKQYDDLNNTRLRVLQNESSENFNQYTYLKELKSRDSIELIVKINEVKMLNKKLDSVISLKNRKNIPFDRIAKEIRLNYGMVTDVAYAEMLYDNNSKVDTIPTFRVSWNGELTYSEMLQFEEKLSKWLAFKIDVENIDVDIKPSSVIPDN